MNSIIDHVHFVMSLSSDIILLILQALRNCYIKVFAVTPTDKISIGLEENVTVNTTLNH